MIPKKLPKKPQSTPPKRDAPTRVANEARPNKVNTKTNFPKSQFTEDGVPILNIPGIDDVDLASTMDNMLKNI